MPSYCIETYGCQMNRADSELLAGILEEHGWVRAGGLGSADVVIINTCSVRERAAERVIGHVHSLAALKKQRPGIRLVLAGCLPQHLGAELAKRLPQVDLFIGPDAYRELPTLLQAEAGGSHLALQRDSRETYAGLIPLRDSSVHAWVSIMRGCDRACTYCAVPFARGRERSLPADRVIESVEQAVADGFAAVTLLGQTVTSYRDGDRDFPWLLERLARTGGLRKLRFLAPHPSDFTPHLLDVIARHPVIGRHLHLPLQSGSDAMLAAMRRGYTRDEYREQVRRARNRIPGVAVTTDLIVGFPGESDADFQATLEMMEVVRFDSAFMFAYSPRERTYAARRLADTVPEFEKKRRLAQVIELQEHHSRERFRAWVGRTVEVLVEGPSRDGGHFFFGRADDFKAVVFESPPGSDPTPGTLVPVRVTEASSHTLRGRPLG